MKRIYVDKAATSYPTAPGVSSAVKRCLDEVSGSVHRSSFANFPEAQEVVWETREKLAALFNFPAAENVVFTMNVTQAVSFLLKGLLRPGDHIHVS